ncbi:cytochrome P450 [Pisolithus croceorrhizus]|nr:cytochrome P450 [Pisolithus croceorrhizus]
MTSYVSTAAQISTVILGLGFFFITRVMAKKQSTYPPEVPSLLPWFGSVFGFVSGPSRFLALCHAQFGPVFRFLLGGRNIIVVSTAEAVHNALFTDYRVLTNRAEHYGHFHVVCNDTSLYPTIFDTFSHKLIPVLDRRLSKRALDSVTTDFAETVFRRLKLQSVGVPVSLRRSLTEPVYAAVTAIFLGSKFSPDSYEDWFDFWTTVPLRLVRRPFWSFPSTRARGRLLDHITTCLQAASPDNDDDKLAGDFSKAVRENNIPFEAASPAVLALMLALHTNLFNNLFWLFSWLLADPRAFSSLRDEIDKGVRKEFGNLQTFISEASPRRLDSATFVLLNSAILEATRLTMLQTGVRLAESDFQLKDGETTIPVRKGEYVLLYSRPAQQNDASYPDPQKFVLDRFVQSEYQSELTPTSGKPYFAFGAGKHVCKGRYLAMFEIKVLTILYLSLFDVTPIPLDSQSSKWEPPQFSPQSVSTTHPTHDVFVKLRPRVTL